MSLPSIYLLRRQQTGSEIRWLQRKRAQSGVDYVYGQFITTTRSLDTGLSSESVLFSPQLLSTSTQINPTGSSLNLFVFVL